MGNLYTPEPADFFILVKIAAQHGLKKPTIDLSINIYAGYSNRKQQDTVKVKIRHNSCSAIKVCFNS